MSDPIIIIGAGICGAVAARILHDAGQQVLVIDKGRGIGGRLATRRIGDTVFDHGAQYFTVRDHHFYELIQPRLRQGILKEWFRKPSSSGEEEVCYIASQGMTSFPKNLLAGIDVLTNVQITQIDLLNNRYKLTSQTGEAFWASRQLLTAPMPQSLTLLQSGNLAIPTEIISQLKSVAYEPCIALMVVIDSFVELPASGHQTFRKGPVSWIANNTQKGISPEGSSAIILHASPDFSKDFWDAHDEHIAHLLLPFLNPWLKNPVYPHYQVKRWKYALTKNPLNQPFITLYSSPQLLIAGDGLMGSRVELAALSGLKAAEELLATSN